MFSLRDTHTYMNTLFSPFHVFATNKNTCINMQINSHIINFLYDQTIHNINNHKFFLVCTREDNEIIIIIKKTHHMIRDGQFNMNHILLVRGFFFYFNFIIKITTLKILSPQKKVNNHIFMT